MTPAMTFAKGYIGARWISSDENGDTLQYKIEIRGANETAWKLIRDQVRERYLSFDSTAFPDGRYIVFEGSGGMFWIRSDGAGQPQRTAPDRL